jgi:hypothetical protein
MIWGKAAWDAWWAWEPRLTTFLIVCLLYGGYFVLRSMVEEESRRATYAAVFAIIAFIDVPITFFATRFLPEGLHPVVITSGRRRHGGQHAAELPHQHARHDAAVGRADPSRVCRRAAQGRDRRPEDPRRRLSRNGEDRVSIEEAAQFVAAAYAVILVVLIAYFAITARRVQARCAATSSCCRREVEKRERRGDGA